MLKLRQLYKSSRGMVYCAKRAALAAGQTCGAWGLWCWQPRSGAWYPLPGEQRYCSQREAEARLAELAQIANLVRLAIPNDLTEGW